MRKKNILRFLRNPLVPSLLSAFVAPGMGQIYNGELKKGFLLLIATFGSVYWFFKVVGDRLALIVPAGATNWYDNPMAFKEQLLKLFNETPEIFILFYALIILLLGYGVIDAFLTAKHRGPKHIRKLTENETDLDR